MSTEWPTYFVTDMFQKIEDEHGLPNPTRTSGTSVVGWRHSGDSRHPRDGYSYIPLYQVMRRSSMTWLAYRPEMLVLYLVSLPWQ